MSGHVEFCDPRPRRKPNAGFTLVELLVVISIIALLVAILMPILGRVREVGKRTKCGANLHSIGQSATTFANDHRGYFPACYRMEDTQSATFPFRVPQFISLDTTHDPDDSQYGWQQFGTSWPMWQQYNANLDIFTCPDALTAAHEIDLVLPTTTPPSAWNNQYGNFISTNYMYLGGLSDQNIAVPVNPNTGVAIGGNKTRSHWGKAPPAVSTSGSPVYAYFRDSSSAPVTMVPVGVAPLAQTVLAADMVYYSGTSLNPPVYNINHPISGNNTLPDFQNVLYGDGRVEGHTQGEYPHPLNDKTYAGSDPTAQVNYSMEFADNQPGYFYWGEQESEPDLAYPNLQKAPNDTPPPDPNAGTGGTPTQQKNTPTGFVTPPPVEPPVEGSPNPIPS